MVIYGVYDPVSPIGADKPVLKIAYDADIPPTNASKQPLILPFLKQFCFFSYFIYSVKVV